MAEVSTVGTWRLGSSWRLRAGGVLPHEQFDQYTTKDWWYGPEHSLNRTDTIKQNRSLQGGRAWGWLTGLAADRTWVKTGVEYARRAEMGEQMLQAREMRYTNPDWTHVMGLFSLTHQWERRSASVFSAEYLEARQTMSFKLDLETPVFEMLLAQYWASLRQHDQVHHTSWRLSKHYMRKMEKGSLAAGLSWTERYGQWQLLQWLSSPNTSLSVDVLRTTSSRETGVYIQHQRMWHHWQLLGDAQLGWLHYRLGRGADNAFLIDQQLPYVNGGIRLKKGGVGANVEMWLRFRKSVPSPLMQLDSWRFTSRCQLTYGLAAPLVRHQFEVGTQWQRSRLIPWRALSANVQVQWGRNAWMPQIRLGSEMIGYTWVEQPTPLLSAQLQTAYEHLFESVFMTVKITPFAFFINRMNASMR